MTTTTHRRRRGDRAPNSEGSSLETRSTRRFEDVSDVLAYDARTGSNSRERRSNGNFRILNETGDDEDARGTRGGRTRERDARMNPAYESGASGAARGTTGAKGANEGKFDATSLLALLGEQYDLKRTTSGNTRLEAKPVAKRSAYETARDAARDEMDENAKPTATGGAKRPAPEYEFVMIGREETKTKASASKVVRFNANENSIVGDSGSPAMATTAATETRAAPWSKAVVERESSVSYAASRGGGSKPGGGIPSYGGSAGASRGGDGSVARAIAQYRAASTRRSDDDSAVRDSSQENSVEGGEAGGKIVGEMPVPVTVDATPAGALPAARASEDALRASQLARQRFQAVSNAAYVSNELDRFTNERRNAAQSVGQSSRGARPTRSTGSQNTHDSLRVQYQQGHGGDVADLMMHRRGDLLRRLGSWLNARIKSVTGFKVAPTFPLDKRIERFVLGSGLSV